MRQAPDLVRQILLYLGESGADYLKKEKQAVSTSEAAWDSCVLEGEGPATAVRTGNRHW